MDLQAYSLLFEPSRPVRTPCCMVGIHQVFRLHITHLSPLDFDSQHLKADTSPRFSSLKILPTLVLILGPYGVLAGMCSHKKLLSMKPRRAGKRSYLIRQCELLLAIPSLSDSHLTITFSPVAPNSRVDLVDRSLWLVRVAITTTHPTSVVSRTEVSPRTTELILSS